MRIVEANKDKSDSIEIGDIFRGDNGHYYILSKTDNGFGTIALGEYNGWNYYANLQDAKVRLKCNVDEGTLTHYSKYSYQLSLEEI